MQNPWVLRGNSDLLVAGAAGLMGLLAILFALPLPIRFILGTPFILLVPGYGLVAALFSRPPAHVTADGPVSEPWEEGPAPTRTLSWAERIVFATAASIATTIVVAYALAQWTGRLSLETASISLMALHVGLLGLAAWRRRPFQDAWANGTAAAVVRFGRESQRLKVGAAVVVALLVFGAAWVALRPQGSTEFWILDASGGPFGPEDLAGRGQNQTLVAVVRTHGAGDASFRISFTPYAADGRPIAQAQSLGESIQGASGEARHVPLTFPITADTASVVLELSRADVADETSHRALTLRYG